MSLRHCIIVNSCVLVLFVVTSPNVVRGGEMSLGTLEARSPEWLAAIGAEFDRARQLVKEERYAEAAGVFEAVATAASKTIKGQRAAVEAGDFYGLAGQQQKAVAMYDLAISIGIQAELSEAALMEKALLHEKQGRSDEALKALEHLRLGYPFSGELATALDGMARITGMTADQGNSRKSAELKASAILRQVTYGITSDRESDFRAGLETIADLQKDYPDTGAALVAEVIKGEILVNLNELEKAFAVLQPLQGRFEAVAPHSEMARKARCLLGRSVLFQGYDLIEGDVKKDDPEMLKRLRGYCDQVIAMEYTPHQVAGAQVLLVALELRQRNPVKAESLTNDFISLYTGRRKVNQFSKELMNLHLLAADAARLNGNTSKALAMCEKVKSIYSELPEQKRHKRAFREIWASAYYKTFMILNWMHADSSAIKAAGEEVIARFPDGPHADAVRKQLGLPVSTPKTE